MDHPFENWKSSYFHCEQSESSSIATTTATPNDRKAREEKCVPYKDPQNETILATQGSYMSEYDLGISEASTKLCQILFDTEQINLKNSLFRDDLFNETCWIVWARNEARFIRDISPLVYSSAEILAFYVSIKPKLLIDSVNQGWNNSIPKLSPYVGGPYDASFFMATCYMYFPFLTCEINCGALDIADRRNAHSMTLALDQKIVCFSISHDNRAVRIYGHYAVIEGETTTFYRHLIRDFVLKDTDKNKWTAYKYTMNVYDKFMPDHLNKIRSAIDALPDNVNSQLSLDDSFLSRIQNTAKIAASSQDIATKLKPTAMFQKEINWLKQRLIQERDECKQQLTQEREESKPRHAELMGLLKKQKEENKRLLGVLHQRSN